MPAEAHHLTVSVWRGDASGGRYCDYRVPARENQTVLDVATWIQRHAEPGLAYRFACRVGMCGSCAMMVDGAPRWTCRTRVAKVARGGRLRLAPLRNMPVIRDLAVDMDPFLGAWARAEARHHPTRSRHDDIARVDPASPERAAADAGIECINCGVCHAACDTAAAVPEYLGPAALLRAWTLVNDARDGGREAILAAVSAPGGCHSCHAIGGCAERCPNGLSPLTAIAGLKRETARGFLRRGGRRNA